MQLERFQSWTMIPANASAREGMGRERCSGRDMNVIDVVEDYLRSRIPGSDVAPLRDVFTFQRETLGFEVFHGSDVAVLEVALDLLDDRVLGDLGARLDALDGVGLLVANPGKAVVVSRQGATVKDSGDS
jgi:hypothetical protein